VGEAKPNTEAFRLIAQRLSLDDPCFGETDRQLIDAVLDGFAENGLRERGWIKVDLGHGPVPHAEGGFGTESGRVTLHADYEPPVEVADATLTQRSRWPSSSTPPSPTRTASTPLSRVPKWSCTRRMRPREGSRTAQLSASTTIAAISPCRRE
jgi:hypothetical protein